VTNLNLANQLDVVEYTFTGLDAGKTYKCSVEYRNDFGNGTPVESAFVSLTRKPQVPLMTTLVENDTAVVINWTAPVDFGQSAITGYSVYKNDVLLANIGNVLTYNATGLSNGVAYEFKVLSTNAIGSSALSTGLSGAPFGAMAIVSSVVVNKTITLTINPNGKPVNRVLMLALDADPTEDPPIFDIPQNQISQTVNANITVVKTFATLSGNITFHLAIAHCNNTVQFHKSP
jgi:hypothetical protein